MKKKVGFETSLSMGCLLLLMISFFTGTANAAPITLDFSGYIREVRTMSADTDLQENDLVSFSITYDPDEPDTQAVPIDFDIRFTTSSGTDYDVSFDTVGSYYKYANYLDSYGYMAFVDWDTDAASGAVQGPSFSSTYPNALTDWIPSQMVVYLPGTVNGFSTPSTDINDYADSYARMGFKVYYDDLNPNTNNSSRSGDIYINYTSVTVSGLNNTPVPLPSTILLLGVGILGLVSTKRKSKLSRS